MDSLSYTRLSVFPGGLSVYDFIVASLFLLDIISFATIEFVVIYLSGVRTNLKDKKFPFCKNLLTNEYTFFPKLR